jgi:hypothetical protein
MRTWAILKWIWLVGANIFYLIVISYVFGQLRGRPETIIVPILGLIYVLIRSFWISFALTVLEFGSAIDGLQAQTRRLAEPSYEPDQTDLEETKKKAASIRAKLYVVSAFLAIVSLLCLLQLFTSL